MIKKLEINFNAIKNNWAEEEDRKNIISYLEKDPRFKNIDVYKSGADLFMYCFKGYENMDEQLNCIDYNYGLTAESVEKYIIDNYGDCNKDDFLVCSYLLSMENEKYYRNGSFIDLNGNNTQEDFYNLEDCDELEKMAEIHGAWVAFSIYKI